MNDSTTARELRAASLMLRLRQRLSPETLAWLVSRLASEAGPPAGERPRRTPRRHAAAAGIGLPAGVTSTARQLGHDYARLRRQGQPVARIARGAGTSRQSVYAALHTAGYDQYGIPLAVRTALDARSPSQEKEG